MTTKSNARLLSFAITRGQRTGDWALACKVALLSAVQGRGRVILGDAYLLVREHLTSHQWSGYMSALVAQGFYTPVDGVWGQINSEA